MTLLKAKTRHSNYLVFLLTSSILLGISAGDNSVFADHPQVDISIAPGSNVPGCEDTDECYIPHEVTVDVGGEVIWANDGSSRTTVTSGTAADGPDGMFDSGLIEPGGSFSFKFEEHANITTFP